VKRTELEVTSPLLTLIAGAAVIVLVVRAMLNGRRRRRIERQVWVRAAARD